MRPARRKRNLKVATTKIVAIPNHNPLFNTAMTIVTVTMLISVE